MSVTIDSVLLDKYWQSGVESILRGQGEEAESLWLQPFFDDEIKIAEEILNQSLIDYVSKAVDRRLAEGEIADAYELVQYLCAVAPNNINALLRFLALSVRANEFDLETLANPDFIELLDQSLGESINPDLMYEFIQRIPSVLTEPYTEEYLNFLRLWALKTIDQQKLVCILAPQALLLDQHCGFTRLRTQILELCLEYSPMQFRFTLLCDLAESTIREKNHQKAIEIGEHCRLEGTNLSFAHQVCGSYRLLTALMEAGAWQRIPGMAQQHQQLLQEFVKNKQQNIPDLAFVITAPYFLNYLSDDPRSAHALRNAIGDICAGSIQLTKQLASSNQQYQSRPKTKTLCIGYIASTLRQHSVGWLSRWLFKYHDRSNFQTYIYHVGQGDNDAFNHKYFRDKVDVAHYLGNNVAEIVNLIRSDEIDILIDLDSVSLSTTYEVMLHKPAPIQTTWLGWDTSGCPEIDYFIADPHVLPADAEEYYRTKIWRLPQTYIAIDGFEVEVPTKRREDYQIPPDAIVYLCAQKSYKHHPDILRLQMQIIKQVPNSYLLVQLRANPESLMKIYQQLADEVGISMEQLRFIKPDPDEMTHRANLQLADVVLDTYPYNGATTTLETLWMGVPMVTKVGQAFVARNSYAFMTNVGVTEGIAHTDEEYVEWGVKLGTNLELRQQIMGKLLHSRKTSPLWDARNFTREMEKAYEQMWAIYQAEQSNAGKIDAASLN
jgi:predicted O-linked N-acetylglucosamine transferase (SPINDLY family)